MIGLIASHGAASLLHAAFSEETPVRLFSDSADKLGLHQIIVDAGITMPVAADAGAVATVASLGRALDRPTIGDGDPRRWFDRYVQMTVLRAHTIWPIGSARELADHIRNHAGPLLLQTRSIGPDDAAVLCRDPDRAAALFASLGDASGGGVARPWQARESYVVDTVSLDGRHVAAGVAEEFFAERSGVLHSRHRIWLTRHDDLAAPLVAAAKRGLDLLGVRDGAAQIRLGATAQGPVVHDIRCAPDPHGVGADAAFAAHGCSHPHLLCESILRPREFARRVLRPPRPPLHCLASVPLRHWGDGDLAGFAGLRVLRRLAGFHSVRLLPREEARAYGVPAVADFLHADRASVESSLQVLHEMTEQETFYSGDQDFIAYATLRD